MIDTNTSLGDLAATGTDARSVLLRYQLDFCCGGGRSLATACEAAGLDLDQVVANYGQRWSIETAFGFLKSKGFHLEETRLTQPARLALLIGLLAVGLLWCLLIGLQRHQQKPIVKKKHGRRAISLFRLGLDRLQQLICHTRYRPKEVRDAGQILLSCT